METQSMLRQTVAEFFRVEVDDVSADFDLRGRLHGSIDKARLDAIVRRRLNIAASHVYSAGTYGELESAILGRPPSPGVSVVPPPQSRSGHSSPPADDPVFHAGPASIACG